MDAERFVGRDTKCALDKAKAKLGADALILSTERSELGIEVSAISAESVGENVAHNQTALSKESVNEITLGYLDRELKALRETLYNALGERTWREASGKVPVSSAVEQRLHTLGISKPAIEELTSNIDFSAGLNIAWSAVLANIISSVGLASDCAASLNTAPKAVIGGSSGCRSLICQQLITQSMQEGAKPSQILVISFTLDPSGALLDFCKRESIKRIQVASMFELRRCLKRVGRHRKVVIETGDLTPSLGSQDPVLELFADYEIGTEAILVVPAIYQSEMLSLSIQHIQSLPIIGAIISRTSEAVSLGAILDALILSEVPLVGTSRPLERVIQRITPSLLINMAKRLAKESSERRKFFPPLLIHSRSA